MGSKQETTPGSLLPFLAVIRASGEDAARFLQGQFTNDTRLLGDGRTQLSACCTPQGRVIALLRLKQADDGILMLLPTDLAESVVTHLRRYVLRARVKLEHATGLVCGTPGTGPTPDGAVSFDYAPGRPVLAAPRESWVTAGVETEGTKDPAARDAWMALDIAGGIPQVFAISSQSYTPQMLNLDLLDGICFDKGCYTGQEIVVRTQHLGRIKRRTLRYRSDGPPPPVGTGLRRDDQKVGEVLVAAPAGSASEFLAVVSLEGRGAGLRLEDDREAVELDMPYEVAGQGEAGSD